MKPLQTIINQLTAQIDALTNENAPAFSQCQATISADLNLLSWLKGQPHYPQFYFSLRERKQNLAAIGELLRIEDLAQANEFVQTHQLPLLGGVQFYGATQFFLPQLLIEQQGEQLCVRVFIDYSDLAASQQKAHDLLKTFLKSTALLPIQQGLTQISQQANQQQWCEWVEQGLARVRAGELNKIVLANATDFISEREFDMRDFVAKSERHNQGCYHFLWAHNANEIFVGASPERLYARQGQNLLTEALAGTAPVTDDAQFTAEQAHWLLNDEKNLYENLLVAQGIQQNLAPYAEHFAVSNVQIKPLRLVQHLIRPIQAQLKTGFGDLQCLQIIHPTAAVAGLPQQAAKQALQQIENFDRTWYAGALGFLSAEHSEFCVALRSAFVQIVNAESAENMNQGENADKIAKKAAKRNKIRVFAGAGIVEGSVPLLEWREIERKAAALISLLQLTE